MQQEKLTLFNCICPGGRTGTKNRLETLCMANKGDAQKEIKIHQLSPNKSRTFSYQPINLFMEKELTSVSEMYTDKREETVMGINRPSLNEFDSYTQSCSKVFTEKKRTTLSDLHDTNKQEVEVVERHEHIHKPNVIEKTDVAEKPQRQQKSNTEAVEKSHVLGQQSQFQNAQISRNLFTEKEYKHYQLCEAKGRRGIVTSLCLDQSISYVRDLNNNHSSKNSKTDQWLVFRYVPAGKKKL